MIFRALLQSRFQISDSESSSGEESVAEEDEEGDTNTPAEPTDDGEQEKASAKQQAIAGKVHLPSSFIPNCVIPWLNKLLTFSCRVECS